MNIMYTKKEFVYEMALYIKKKRIEKGVSQKDFYCNTNIHIGRIEQGKTDIGIFTFFKICQFFDVELVDLSSHLNKLMFKNNSLRF